MLYNRDVRDRLDGVVVNCFQFCNNFDVVQLHPSELVALWCCELLSIL